MAEDAQTYRGRAAAARGVAAGSRLPNVRDRALRSAFRWDELAAQVERAERNAEGGGEGLTGRPSSIARMSFDAVPV